MFFLYDAFLRAPAVLTDAEPTGAAASLPVAGGPESGEALFSSFWPQPPDHSESQPPPGNSLPAGGNDLPTRELPEAGVSSAVRQSLLPGRQLPGSPGHEDGETLPAAARPGVSGALQRPAAEPAPSEVSALAPLRHVPTSPELPAKPLEIFATATMTIDSPATPPPVRTSTAPAAGQPAFAGRPPEVPAEHGPLPRARGPRTLGPGPLAEENNTAARQERLAVDLAVRPRRSPSGLGSDAAQRSVLAKTVPPAVHASGGLEPPTRPAGVNHPAGVERLVTRQLVPGELDASAVSAEKEPVESLPTGQKRVNAFHSLEKKIDIKQYTTPIIQKLDKVQVGNNNTPASVPVVRQLSPAHNPQRVVPALASARSSNRVRPTLPAGAAAGDRAGPERVATAVAPVAPAAPAPERPADLGPISGFTLPAKSGSTAGANQEPVRQITAKTPATAVVQATTVDNSAAAPAPIEPVSAARAQPALLAMPISHDVVDERWGRAIGERLLVMVDKLIGKARIQLNPAHLGPVKVEIDTVRGGSTVEFVAASPITREALESALPRLREMFEQQGLSLSEASVRDEPGRQTDAREERRENQRTADSWSRREQTDPSAARHPTTAPDANALIDTYV